MPKPATPLYVDTNRHVAAIDPRTGAELWRTKLPHGGGGIVAILIGKACLFVGHAGYAYCLDERSGSIQWENGLPRMGYHPVLLALDSAAGRPPRSLFIGTNRFAAALDPRTGAELWRTKLPHSGSAVVAILVDEGHLLVGHAGYVYSLARNSGEILWENGLPRMGYHAVIPAMEGVGGTLAAAAAAAQRAQQQRHAAATGAAAGS